MAPRGQPRGRREDCAGNRIDKTGHSPPMARDGPAPACLSHRDPRGNGPQPPTVSWSPRDPTGGRPARSLGATAPPVTRCGLTSPSRGPAGTDRPWRRRESEPPASPAASSLAATGAVGGFCSARTAAGPARPSHLPFQALGSARSFMKRFPAACPVPGWRLQPVLPEAGRLRVLTLRATARRAVGGPRAGRASRRR